MMSDGNEYVVRLEDVVHGTHVAFAIWFVTFTTSLSCWLTSMVGPGNMPVAFTVRVQLHRSKLLRTVHHEHGLDDAIWSSWHLLHDKVVVSRLWWLARHAMTWQDEVVQ